MTIWWVDKQHTATCIGWRKYTQKIQWQAIKIYQLKNAPKYAIENSIFIKFALEYITYPTAEGCKFQKKNIKYFIKDNFKILFQKIYMTYNIGILAICMASINSLKICNIKLFYYMLKFSIQKIPHRKMIKMWSFKNIFF